MRLRNPVGLNTSWWHTGVSAGISNRCGGAPDHPGSPMNSIGSLAAPMPECPNDGRVRNLIGANMSVRAEVLRRSGGFASKLGRREAGGAIIGSVAESSEETEFCVRAARLHPGGMWIHCEKARVLHVVTRQRTTWRYFVRRCRMEGTAKAVLTGLTGTQDGLGSERRHTRTLVVSILRHIVSGNLTRAATIFAGLTITAAAYGRGKLALCNF